MTGKTAYLTDRINQIGRVCRTLFSHCLNNKDAATEFIICERAVIAGYRQETCRAVSSGHIPRAGDHEGRPYTRGCICSPPSGTPDMLTLSAGYARPKGLAHPRLSMVGPLRGPKSLRSHGVVFFILHSSFFMFAPFGAVTAAPHPRLQALLIIYFLEKYRPPGVTLAASRA